MNFDYIHNNLLQITSKSQFNFICFYYPFPASSFISTLIPYLINKTAGNIYLLNFNDSQLSPIPFEISKAHPKQFTPNTIISLSSKIFLIDLLSQKISPEIISAIIIGDNKQITNESKIVFIIKYLLNKPSSFIHFYHISNNIVQFNKNLFTILNYTNIKYKYKSNPNDITIGYIPRYHPIVHKLIECGFQYKDIKLEEYNVNIPLSCKVYYECMDTLKKLKTNCISEMCSLIKNDIKNKMNNIITTLCNCGYLFKKNYMSDIKYIFSKYANNESAFLALLHDIKYIEYLQNGLDYIDIPTVYARLTSIIKRLSVKATSTSINQSQNEPNNYYNQFSIFNYQDTETLLLLDSLKTNLKDNIYEIIETSNEDEISLINRFIDLSQQTIPPPPHIDKYYSILTSYKLEVKIPNLNEQYPLYDKLITILDNSLSGDKREKVLIITKTQSICDIIKQILISKYVSLDNKYTGFHLNNMRNFLLQKHEFTKRKKILNNPHLNVESAYFRENLLLHYTCFKLCALNDEEKEIIFNKIVSLYNDDDLLPSEIEITQEMYEQVDNSCYNNENLILPHHIEIFPLCSKESDEESKYVTLNSKLKGYDYNFIIFFGNQIDVTRFLEVFIINNNNIQNDNNDIKNNEYICSIDKLILMNNISSYSFSKEIHRLKSEFLTFKKSLINYKEFITKYNNDVTMSDKEVNENDKKEISTEINNMNILIDFREMSAKCPFYLYSKGFNINIASLEVGDYITSNTVCIERKSITTNDLFESLKSTRLINQIVKMEKYYTTIIILLELETIDDLIKVKNNGGVFSQRNLFEKFIDLKNLSTKVLYVWSFSPKMTAELLFKIKYLFKNDYLDVNKCISVNKKYNNSKKQKGKIEDNKQKSIFSFIDKGSSIKEEEEEEDLELEKYECDNNNMITNKGKGELIENDVNLKRRKINIEKFIRSVDGVNTGNYNVIIKKFKTLKEFITCDKEVLYEEFGRINGNKIHCFFTYKYNCD